MVEKVHKKANNLNYIVENIGGLKLWKIQIFRNKKFGKWPTNEIQILKIL